MAGPGEWGQDGTFYDNFESGSGSRYEWKIATVLFLSLYFEISCSRNPSVFSPFRICLFFYQTKIGKKLKQAISHLLVLSLLPPKNKEDWQYPTFKIYLTYQEKSKQIRVSNFCKRASLAVGKPNVC